ncbi:MAG: hypothetical protein ACOYYS_00930 [Chloroflexota bacterium]
MPVFVGGVFAWRHYITLKKAPVKCFHRGRTANASIRLYFKRAQIAVSARSDINVWAVKLRWINPASSRFSLIYQALLISPAIHRGVGMARKAQFISVGGIEAVEKPGAAHLVVSRFEPSLKSNRAFPLL